VTRAILGLYLALCHAVTRGILGLYLAFCPAVTRGNLDLYLAFCPAVTRRNLDLYLALCPAVTRWNQNLAIFKALSAMARGNLDTYLALFPTVTRGNLNLYSAFCPAATHGISVSVHSSEGPSYQVTSFDKQRLLQDLVHVYDPQGSSVNKGNRSDTKTRYQPGFFSLFFPHLDFGFSIQGKESNKALTSRCGTFSYNAPEVITASSYNGFQADIWSLYVTISIFISTCILIKP
jgi:hypothetical protein